MRFFAAAPLFAVLPVFAGSPRVVTDGAVTVFVRRHGDLSGVLWQGTKAATTSIFEDIGVAITWKEGRAPAALEPVHATIQLHLTGQWGWQTRETGPRCSDANALACALPFARGAVSLIVMYDRLLRAVPHPRLVQSLLAHTIAHEIAHILQVTTAHSRSGIMKEHWETEDFARMERSRLEFTSEDVQRIQSGFDYRRRIGSARAVDGLMEAQVSRGQR